MMKKKIVAMLLAAVMAFGLLPGTVWAAGTEKSGFDNFPRSNRYDGRFTDLDSSAWYYDSVITAYEYGLMNGKGDVVFAPDSHITLAEVITLASRVLNTYNADHYDFTARAGMAWYQPYVNYALQHGILTYWQYYYYDFNAEATRGDMAQIFSAMPDDLFKPVNSVDDGSIPDVAPGSDCEEAVYQLYRAGILTGSDTQGTMYPDNPISRKEVATIVTRIAVPSMRKSLTLTSVMLYSDNGKTIRVAPSKLNSYLKLGWRTEPFTLPASSSAKTLLNSTTLLPMKTGFDKLDNLVDDIFAQIITDKMTTYQKVKACYDYLINNTVYQGTDEAADALWDEAFNDILMDVGSYYWAQKYVLYGYATLVSGSGLCDHYSGAFMVMTRRIGVDCCLFEGDCRSSKGGYSHHVWNVVTIGGVEYIFDAEVEDKNTTNGNIRDRYFCKTFEDVNTRDGDRGPLFTNYQVKIDFSEYRFMAIV